VDEREIDMSLVLHLIHMSIMTSIC